MNNGYKSSMFGKWIAHTLPEAHWSFKDFEINSDEEIVNKNFTGKLSNYLIGESMNDDIRE